MAWTISDLFPDWGEAGASPSDGFFYEGGDQVNEKHMDYLWDNLDALQDEVRAALTDIDSDADGIVDEADAAQSASTSFDLNGNALVDDSRGYIELGDSDDLLLKTGQKIRLGDNTQYSLWYDGTDLRFNDQNTDNTQDDLSSRTIGIDDAIALYTEDKVISVKVNSDRTITGKSQQILFNDNSTSLPSIYADSGDLVSTDGNSNFVNITDADWSGKATNLSLATGQAIVDGGGTKRFDIPSTSTRIRDEGGGIRFQVQGGSYIRPLPTAGTPWVVYDSEGSFNAYKYIPSATAPGTLELTNANLVPDAAGNRKVGTSTTYFNEMHATNFISHSPEPRDFTSAMDTLQQYTDGYGEMNMGEMIANLATVIEKQRHEIEQLKTKVGA